LVKDITQKEIRKEKKGGSILKKRALPPEKDLVLTKEKKELAGGKEIVTRQVKNGVCSEQRKNPI